MKNNLKKLKNIKPDKKQKEEFRKILAQKAEIAFEENKNFYSFTYIFKKMPKLTAIFTALALIVSLASGVAYASEKALPGESLYKIKRVMEEARIVLTQDDIKKATLYLEFAQKRLNELQKIANSDLPEEVVINVITTYQKQLKKSEEALLKKPKPETAKILDSETQKNQIKIANLAQKLNKPLSKKLLKAYEETENTNDNANLIILTSISPENKENTKTDQNKKQDNSPKNIKDKGFLKTKPNKNEKDNYKQKPDTEKKQISKKATQKIFSVKSKINEIKKYLSENSKKYNLSEAEQKLKKAETLIQQAEKTLNSDPKKSLKTAILANKQIQKAKKIIEHKKENENNNKDKNEDKKEYEFEFNFIKDSSNTTSKQKQKETKLKTPAIPKEKNKEKTKEKKEKDKYNDPFISPIEKTNQKSNKKDKDHDKKEKKEEEDDKKEKDKD